MTVLARRLMAMGLFFPLSRKVMGFRVRRPQRGFWEDPDRMAFAMLSDMAWELLVNFIFVRSFWPSLLAPRISPGKVLKWSLFRDRAFRIRAIPAGLVQMLWESFETATDAPPIPIALGGSMGSKSSSARTTEVQIIKKRMTFILSLKKPT
jgi:hypothetical protein